MVVKAAAIDVLLVLGIALQLFAVLGMTVMQDPFDRMHYAAAATTFGPFLVAAAIIVDQSLSEMGAKALLVAVVLVAGNPVLTHATARMARIRSADGIRIDGDDVEHGSAS
jgi:monovalent cation/proton antiporter MnhG/PhaG subunit